MIKTLTLLVFVSTLAKVAYAQSFSFAVAGTQQGPLSSTGDGLAVADFNGDGRMDIVTTNLYKVIRPGDNGDGLATAVFLSGSDGQLQPPLLLQAGSDYYGQGITTADVTGDGQLDILIASGGRPTLFVNQGNGSFGPPLAIVAFPESLYNGFYDNLLAVADFNGDGHPDIAKCHSGGIFILLGTGSANTGWFRPASGPTVPLQYADAVLASDLDQDGLADLVNYGRFNRDQSTVYLNTAKGTTFTKSLTFSSEELPVVADLDGDGKLDILTYAATGLWLHRNLGQGTFSAPVSTGITTSLSTVAADFDGDGRLDLAQAGSNGILLYRNLGAGLFTPTAQLVPFSPSTLGVGDVNGDGRCDIVGLAGNTTVTVLLNKSQVLATRAPQARAFALSPNPVTDEAHLELPNAVWPVQVDVYNMTGQLDRRTEVHLAASPLSVRGLQPGLYTVRVHDTQGQQWVARLQVH